MTVPLFCRMAESVSLRCLLDAQQNEKARMCVVSQSLPALLYVTLKYLLCIRLSCSCSLLQTALGIMSTFAAGETSAIDETTNTCVIFHMRDEQAHARANNVTLLDNNQNVAFCPP